MSDLISFSLTLLPPVNFYVNPGGIPSQHFGFNAGENTAIALRWSPSTFTMSSIQKVTLICSEFQVSENVLDFFFFGRAAVLKESEGLEKLNNGCDTNNKT